MTKEENILLTAEKLFAERGFEATSTREISKAANVNVSMISYYFGSKEKLLEKIFEYRMQQGSELSREIFAKTDMNEWEKLTTILSLYLKRAARLRDFYRIMHAEQITNKNSEINNFMKNSKLGYLEVYRNLLEDGYSNGIFTKKPRVELLHATIIGTVFYAFHGLDLYKEFSGSKKKDETFYREFYRDLELHLKNLIKNLLGYEEK